MMPWKPPTAYYDERLNEWADTYRTPLFHYQQLFSWLYRRPASYVGRDVSHLPSSL